MKSFSKITLINLAALLAYSLLIRLAMDSEKGGGLGIAIYSCFLIIVHIIVNIALSIHHYTYNERQLGSVYLLNIFIVLIVGFGVCSVNSSI